MAYSIYACKRVRGNASGLQEEHQRTKDSDITRMSPAIDGKRTVMNQHWGARDYEERARELCDDLNVKVRSNSVLVLDHVVTFSPEWAPHFLYLMHNNGTPQDTVWKHTETGQEICELVEAENLPHDEIIAKAKIEARQVDAYFRESLKWISQKRGVLISYDIHWDESTPHVHAQTVPLVERENGWALSAKEIVGNKAKMAKTQTDFNQSVGLTFGLERGVHRETPAEAMEKMSNAVYWAKTADKVVKDAKETISTTNKEISESLKRKDNLEIEVANYERIMRSEKKKFAVDMAEKARDIVDEFSDEVDKTLDDRLALLLANQAKEKLKRNIRLGYSIDSEIER